MEAKDFLEAVQTMVLTLGLSFTALGALIIFIIKGLISNQLDRSLERFKIQFSKLHEMRATAISELYSVLVDVETSLRNWIYKDMPVGVDPPKVDLPTTIKQVRDLRLLERRSRILLTSDTCELIDGILTEVESVERALENREIIPDEEESWKYHEDAMSRLLNTIPEIKIKLEGEFREVLGAS
jgi:hypothetical protein